MIDLDRHIEILLLSNDCVIVPDFGGFMAHHIDARKDESDGSFLPPIRSIGFNPKLTINDSLLAQSYVETYDISYPDAIMRIEDEVRELRQRISADGKYEFNDIGTVSLNEDGNYEFTPCEAGIVSPELYGLGSYRMKTIKELKASLQSEESASLRANDKEGEDDSKQLEDKVAEEVGINQHAARTIALWRNVAVACIAVIIFLLIPSPLVNSTQMAGNYINTGLLDRVLPKDITTGQEKVAKAVKSEDSRKIVAEKLNAEKQQSQLSAKKENSAQATIKDGYAIVLASHVTLKNANAYVNKLHQRGYDKAYVYNNGHVKVLFGKYTTREEASKALNTINNDKELEGAWITNVKF